MEKDNMLEIRTLREIVCFPIVNRGQLWYNTLTLEQRDTLETWYHAWLDAPETGIVPETPNFIK